MKGISAQTQNDLVVDALEDKSIFKLQTNKSKPVVPKGKPSLKVGAISFCPIRDQTSEDQEVAAYRIIWDMCSRDRSTLPLDHPLIKYKGSHAGLTTKTYELYGRLWGHTVVGIYQGYDRKRVRGAVMAVEYLCIDGVDLRALLCRYGKPQDLQALFYWANHHIGTTTR